MTRRHVTIAVVGTLAIVLASCGSAHEAGTRSATTPPTAAPIAATTVSNPATSSQTTTPTRIIAHVWADNWYALYVNGQKIAEDTEPLTQVRSFNADTISFTATYPLIIAMITKDYTEGTSGLEYIGTPQQQMGDGGFIAQFTETDTGRTIAVTNERWHGLVIQRAPLNEACVTDRNPNTTCTYEQIGEPAGWTEPGFDASSWPTATVYTAAQVGPKGGYDTISWNPTARLIWTTDLFVDNTILWRYTAAAPR